MWLKTEDESHCRPLSPRLKHEIILFCEESEPSENEIQHVYTQTTKRKSIDILSDHQSDQMIPTSYRRTRCTTQMNRKAAIQ